MHLRLVEIYTNRAAEGIAECEHALELDRNLASARAMIGYGKIFIGRADQTEAHIAEALRLSPRDTLAYIWMSVAGDAKNHLGSWEQAVEWFRRAIEADRNYPTIYFNLAAALAHLGRLVEAHSAIRAGLALNPAFAISRARAARTARSDNPTYLAELERILEGMGVAESPSNDRRPPPRPDVAVEFALAEAHGAAIRYGAAACDREEARRVTSAKCGLSEP